MSPRARAVSFAHGTVVPLPPLSVAFGIGLFTLVGQESNQGILTSKK